MKDGPSIKHTLGIVAIAICLALTTVLVAGNGPVSANEIAVIVNGNPITTYDLDRRRKLLRLQRTKGNLKKKAQEQLIEEAIKMSEVRRLRATVSGCCGKPVVRSICQSQQTLRKANVANSRASRCRR